MIDARGGAVLPGFNDSHVDLIGGGLRLTRGGSVGRRQRRRDPRADPRLGRANPAPVGGRQRLVRRSSSRNGLPTRQLLDSVISDRPALIYAADEGGPPVWVNSKALQLAGHHAEHPDPDDGCDHPRRTAGEPTGVLRAAALRRRRSSRPTRRAAEALRAAVAEANSGGITSAQNTAASCERDLNSSTKPRAFGRLTLRVYARLVASIPMRSPRGTTSPSYDAIRKRYPDDPLFKVGALSFPSTAPSTRALAALLEPYADAAKTRRCSRRSRRAEPRSVWPTRQAGRSSRTRPATGPCAWR